MLLHGFFKNKNKTQRCPSLHLTPLPSVRCFLHTLQHFVRRIRGAHTPPSCISIAHLLPATDPFLARLLAPSFPPLSSLCHLRPPAHKTLHLQTMPGLEQPPEGHVRPGGYQKPHMAYSGPQKVSKHGWPGVVSGEIGVSQIEFRRRGSFCKFEMF